MPYRAVPALILLATLWPLSSAALDASDLDDLVGWTIVASSNVVDEFEGCDFDKNIELDNGWVLTCLTYLYSYSYRPEVAVFAKEIEYQGRAYWMIKAVIDDEIYDMQAIAAR